MANKEVCSPITTLEDFFNYMINPPKWGILTAPIEKRSGMVRNKDLYENDYACHYFMGDKVPNRYKFGELPKTLVCHDMKNGYNEDRFLNGIKDHSHYLFYHWAAIDIFVYFSHNFITIPPLGWINVAHKHGVKILGTIITEWDDGYKLCQEFLKSDEEINKFTDQLIEITKYFKIDGWLINIENKITDVNMLLKFIQQLTEKIHGHDENSLIIWYDSVIDTGALNWQDCLNSKNKIFFDSCDGLFTNYSWTIEHLKLTVQAAGVRKHDVFVGVDVWGRNFWGGGHFNTAEAIKEIYNYGLSMAIFAPAWTHEAINLNDLKEKLNPLSSNDLTIDKCYDENIPLIKCIKKDYFMLRENALWSTLWPYLNIRGPTKLPFHTFFCIGSGTKRRYNGKVIRDELWFNLRKQQYQLSTSICNMSFSLELISEQLNIDSSNSNNATANPDYDITTLNKKPRIKRFVVKPTSHTGCLTYYTDDSFFGGNCIKICPINLNTHENEISHKYIRRLFVCEFHCDNNFIIYYITKTINDSSNQNLNLVLTIKNNTKNKINKFVLLGQNTSMDIINGNDCTFINPFDSENINDLKTQLELNYPGFYVDINNNYGWNIRYYVIKCPNSVMLDINCEIVNSSPVLLGGLGIINDIPM